MTKPQERPLLSRVPAMRTLEGGGFPVRRPLPTAALPLADPFLLIDEMGPKDWAPGQAIGAPDHPHRGFETVTYLLRGRNQHRDSQGHSGLLNPGDVQWMTAGSGVVHSEMPEAEFRRTGGVVHGFQIWVNLPAARKMMAPRYQEVPAAQIPQARSEDGRVQVRVIAGESMGAKAVIDTVTPIMLMHFTLHPGGEVLQPVPAEHNAIAYVFGGAPRLGPQGETVPDGHLAIFGDGGVLRMAGAPGKGAQGIGAQAASNAAAAPAEVLLLTGVPLGEPVARHGPFVMNTRQELIQAFRDYEEGRMGGIGG